jgi:hypothetical protein
MRRDNAKLGIKDVIDIRRAHQDGESYLSLARYYGVSSSAIRSAAIRLTWKYVDWDRCEVEGWRAEDHCLAKLTAKAVIAIRRRRRRGETLRSIGCRYGVVRTTILAIVHGRTWKHIPED